MICASIVGRGKRSRALILHRHGEADEEKPVDDLRIRRFGLDAHVFEGLSDMCKS
jgi:hypothetical protein